MSVRSNKRKDIASRLKPAAVAIGIVMGVVIAFTAPPEGLGPEAMRALGLIACCIIWMIFNVLPEYVLMLAMSTGLVLFKCVSFTIAFGTFSGTNVWLLIGAIGMGVAGERTGLLKRMSLYIMKLFPASFSGQVAALISSSLVVGPLIPSTTAKSAIMAPISMTMSDAMGYERKSKPAAGLFGAYFTGYISGAPIFLSASFLGYTAWGFMPKEIQREFTWMKWFLSSLPWSIIMLALCYAGIILLYKPSDDKKLPAEYILDNIKNLGPMSRRERITLTVMLVSLVFWIMERATGINAATTSLVALCVLLGFNVITKAEFRTGVPWEQIIYVGAIINIGNVMSSLKIDKWLGDQFGHIITPLMERVWLFVPLCAIVIFISRFVIVSQTAAMTVFSLILIPLAQRAGISPYVIVFIAYTSIQIWIVKYQSANYIIGDAATNGEFVLHKHTIPLSLVYQGASLLGLMACIPFWNVMGLVP